MLGKLREFIRYGIWRIRADRLTRRDSFFVRMARIFILSLRGFGNDQCYLRASALTFYTMLSIVPVFALALAIARGFGLEVMLEKKLLQIPAQEIVMIRLIEFARNMLQNAQGGIIAGIGVGFLLWTVVKVLEHIEKSFNVIWGVKRSRSWARKFTDYFSLMFVCPLLFITASSMTVFITTLIQNLTAQHQIFQFLTPVFFSLISLLPYIILWALLTFLYVFMPNTRVQFSAALTGGVLAGTIYQLVQWGYLWFQIEVAQFNVIYGSFAALPLFLVWLQLSWLIVLYGAEISFACQNESTYELEPESAEASHRLKAIVALMITSFTVKRFHELKDPLSSGGIAKELELPVRLVRDVIDMLVKARVLTLVGKENTDSAFYQPGRPTENMTVKMLLESLDSAGLNSLTIAENHEMDRSRRILERLWARLEHVPENINVKGVLDRRPEESAGPFSINSQ